ncbi:MAG: cytidine deaminase [Verrucomicrobia bacterium]|nr:MAG: cytidine deaminase [Verrucomicrobiota bacterium]
MRRNSKFVVGAAVKCKSRAVVAGTNIENRSFGLTICAERVAMCAAVAGSEQDFVAIAVAADSDEPVVPSEACRQFLAEFNPDLIIVRATVRGQRKIENLSHLFADATRGILEHADLT